MVEFLPSKQAVAGSSPVSRSRSFEGGACRTKKMSIEILLSRYHLAARAEGLSEKTVDHIRFAAVYHRLAGSPPVAWPAPPQERGGDAKLSKTSVNTSTRGLRASTDG